MSGGRGAAALLRHPGHLLALGFGTGLARRAPGTIGSLAAAGLWMLAAALGAPLWALAAAAVLAAVVGVPLCAACARALGGKDPAAIVWDEWAGTWIALCLAPPGLWWWLLALALFRVFDIAKPWPIGHLDRRVGGGLGIMLDDVLAAVIAGGLATAAHAAPGLLQ